MNTGSVLFPSRSPTSSRPQSSLSSYDDYPNQPYNDHPHNRLSRPPTNGRHAYPHQPFPLNPSPRHYLYPPYAQNPPPPLRPSTLPPPPSFDDPAFSSDPRANPHFAMNSAEQFIPLNPSAANIVSSSCHHQRPSSHPISFLHPLCVYLAKHFPSFSRQQSLSSLQRFPGPCPGYLPKTIPQNHLFHPSKAPTSCRLCLLPRRCFLIPVRSTAPAFNAKALKASSHPDRLPFASQESFTALRLHQ